MQPIVIKGVELYKGFLDGAAQSKIVDDIRKIASVAPLYSPVTRWGKPMSVRMTSAGEFGWYSDAKGYRYISNHPNGTSWPKIPASVMSIWTAVSKSARDPECCLVNFYNEVAKMGLHQDKDEANFDHPVVSISLGDEGLFRIGNKERGGKSDSIWLQSGDVLVLGGKARLLHHGIDKIRMGSSSLLENGGRLNLTLRIVT